MDSQITPKCAQTTDQIRLKVVDYPAYEAHKANDKYANHAELLQLMRYYLHADF